MTQHLQAMRAALANGDALRADYRSNEAERAYATADRHACYATAELLAAIADRIPAED